MIVAIVGILSWRFPSQVGELIGRITSIGASGVRANPPDLVVTQELKEITKPEHTEELLRIFDNQLLVQHEGYIRDSFLKNVDDPATRERILLRHLRGCRSRTRSKQHIIPYGVRSFTPCNH